MRVAETHDDAAKRTMSTGYAALVNLVHHALPAASLTPFQSAQEPFPRKIIRP